MTQHSLTQLSLDFSSPDPRWRELEDLEAQAERHRAFDDHFGRCPDCGEPGLCLNVERAHWFVCRHHRRKWYVGANLFSAWKYEDESVWENNACELDAYTAVDPRTVQ
jgi:hypothetical protein